MLIMDNSERRLDQARVEAIASVVGPEAAQEIAQDWAYEASLAPSLSTYGHWCIDMAQHESLKRWRAEEDAPRP